MLLQGLVEATLLKRYKRFLADVCLADGSEVTAHCPNPGSMLGLADEGMKVYLQRSEDPKRKLPWSWKVVVCPSSLVVVDTMLANKLFLEAFNAGVLTELADFEEIKAEQTYGDSRFDFKLSCAQEIRSDCRNGNAADAGADAGDTDVAGAGAAFVEVKSTTLIDGRVALFPDARTERGRKHLETLRAVKKAGMRAVQFYLVGRSDALSFSPADSIDPLYGQALRRAASEGVDIFARRLEFAEQPVGAPNCAGNGNRVIDLTLQVGAAVAVQL